MSDWHSSHTASYLVFAHCPHSRSLIIVDASAVPQTRRSAKSPLGITPPHPYIQVHLELRGGRVF